jgi:CRP/FNR family transcriptional regulator, cyclic AMP receptor protein
MENELEPGEAEYFLRAMSQTGEIVRVLEVDPDLAEGLSHEQEMFLRAAAIAPVDILQPGPWRGDKQYPGHDGHLGLLILDGLLAREMRIGERTCVELLGPGDLLRPWVKVAAYSSVAIDSSWTVVEPTRIAVLDSGFAATVAPYPQITGTVLDRMMARSRWLGFHLAVCHLRLIEERLLVVLWHFADRWGRVTPEGIVLPLRITHKMLAGVVGAQRPSVTTALGVLRREGLVERLPHGNWRLHGSPPEAFGRIEKEAGGRPFSEDQLD